MSSIHYETVIGLLKSFDRNDLRVAEIGVWKCHLLKKTLRAVGDLVDQYWAVDFWKAHDHWNVRNVSQEQWDALYHKACKMMYWFPQVHVARMHSCEAALLFPEKYFDLVFIDADHVYESVMNDIKAWHPLVKNGGLLTGHDYGGRKHGVKQAVDECFGEDGIEVINWCWVKRVEE